MRRKSRFLLLLVAVLVLLTFTGAHSVERVVLGDDTEARQEKIENDFGKAYLLAKANYAGQIDIEKVTKASITGMLHTLDPHSSYLDQKEWSDFQEGQQSRYSGIGSTIAQRDGKVYITSPFYGTPAYKAGILYGDQIAEINGESTEGWTSQQVSNKLLGPEGTPVTVKVKRLGVAEPLEFKLVRDYVPLPSIANYFMLGKGIGYINLQRGFNLTTAEETENALKYLHEQGMTSLILDLRANRGGLVDQARKVANDFLFKGQRIVSMRGRPGVFPARDLNATNPAPDDVPMVVLVDRGTASAAEIVSAALQDHDRARLVGENSFGKGLVQNVFNLRDGSGLTLTAGKYYTPSGRLIQRDYSNRSFYDYYLQRGDKEELEKHHPDEKHTDNGRPVYGGDGINPDVEVKIPTRDLDLQRIWIEPVFEFARELVAGRVAGFPEFKIERPADHSHRLRPDEYQVNDKMLAAFKSFLGEYKEIKAYRDRIDKAAEFIKRQIRYEAV
ncbi:MAG TPA: S41 family peptidase, partial [Blastocatellia bacterium]|nr:S41 family peptidase [Blastocatellia bacterium]